MSIASALSNANSGLSVASRRANLVSNNVANALTPGYAKRTLSVSENIVAGRGAGVSVDGVARAGDSGITSDRRRADAAQANDQVAAGAYASFNSILGEPDDPFSLFGQYQDFETSLRSLSQTPESQPLQSRTLDAAKSLASTFNSLAGEAQAARQNADAEIARQVELVNGKLKQIEDLNNEISIAGAGGRDATALEDQRKVLIDEVSEVIPVRELPRDNRKIDLITHEGIILLAGKAREIEFTPAGAISPTDTLGSGALSGLSVDGADFTPGTGGSLSLRQGQMAGLFQVRDEIAPDFQTKIDALARDVIERFENIDPTLTPGDPGLFTDAGAAFDPLAEAGLAGRIAINAAVDPEQGGEIWRLRDGLGATTEGPSGASDLIVQLLDSLTEVKPPPSGTGLSGSLDAISAAANVTSAIGASRITAETKLAATAARAEALLENEMAVSAVDTDFELQQLILIEQAFAANARVIQTADQMIRTLMEL